MIALKVFLIQNEQLLWYWSFIKVIGDVQEIWKLFFNVDKFMLCYNNFITELAEIAEPFFFQMKEHGEINSSRLKMIFELPDQFVRDDLVHFVFGIADSTQLTKMRVVILL